MAVLYQVCEFRSALVQYPVPRVINIGLIGFSVDVDSALVSFNCDLSVCKNIYIHLSRWHYREYRNICITSSFRVLRVLAPLNMTGRKRSVDALSLDEIAERGTTVDNMTDRRQ